MHCLGKDAEQLVGPVEGPSVMAQQGADRGEHLRRVVEVAPVPLFVLAPSSGRFLCANEPLAQVLDCRGAELGGLSLGDFVENPADFAAMLAALEAHGEDRRELAVRTVGGQSRWVLARTAKTQIGDQRVLMGGLDDISDRRQAEEALCRSEAARAQACEHVEALGVELSDAQTRLLQAEKMASLGMLVAGIAHEINTPIGAISSMHDTLVRAVGKLRCQLTQELGEDQERNAGLQRVFKFIDESNRVIADGAGRVTTIVKRLRSFARLDVSELQEADLNEGIEDTLTLLQHEFKHHIEVRKELGPLPRITCCPGRLNQVFLNLLMNARQAITQGGTITIRTWHEQGFVKVSIADDGCGIAAANLRRVFDPGFTTKGAGVGTGLGLAICYQIVDDHGGDIDVQSELGVGTTFTVSIPVHPQSACCGGMRPLAIG